MIGGKLKDIRKSAGMTLQELAAMTDLSTAYLSNVEREATSPTLQNLAKISKSLRIDITELFSGEQTIKEVVRKDERREVLHSNTRAKYQLTTDGADTIKGLCITLPVDFNDEIVSLGHDGDEFGIITEGKMLVRLNGNEYILEPGDSIYIPTHTPHNVKRVGDVETVSYWTFVRKTPDLSYVEMEHYFA